MLASLFPPPLPPPPRPTYLMMYARLSPRQQQQLYRQLELLRLCLCVCVCVWDMGLNKSYTSKFVSKFRVVKMTRIQRSRYEVGVVILPT